MGEGVPGTWVLDCWCGGGRRVSKFFQGVCVWRKKGGSSLGWGRAVGGGQRETAATHLSDSAALPPVNGGLDLSVGVAPRVAALGGEARPAWMRGVKVATNQERET